jgi:hypothetical protein
MKFRALQENLRKLLLKRIEAGELTGLHLAEQTRFQQAHISNFLNRKRGLSVEGMDRVLTVQRLSILDLIDPAEVNRRSSLPPVANDEFESVPIAESGIAASQPVIMNMQIRDVLKFRKSFLGRLRSQVEGEQAGWQRFVIIKVGQEEGMSMYPRTLPGAALLLDRHYNSLAPYRRGEPNIYAVRKSRSSDGPCSIRYVESAPSQLILRPHNPAYPINMIPIAAGERPCDYIVGRVCHVGVDT